MFEQELQSESSVSVLNQQQEDQSLVCVKNYLTNPNPLMHKIQYEIQSLKNYYPSHTTKLPQCLNTQEYHIDKNYITMIEQNNFMHEKLKKDVMGCMMQRSRAAYTKKKEYKDLITLQEYYEDQTPIYEKYSPSDKVSYFATYVLSMQEMAKQQLKQKSQNNFIIRNNKTPSLIDKNKQNSSPVKQRISKLEFNSNFESGNLFRVYHKQAFQYDLILQNDINTKGNNQWFFFSVKNAPPNTTIKFNIVNMSKRQSLFEFGMKPAVFSMVRKQKRSVGWVREGTKVHYSENQKIRKQSRNQPYYCLSFEYKFVHEGDIVYFSQSIPYSFTMLETFLLETISNPKTSKILKIKPLALTVGGSELPLLILTNSATKNPKKIIYIMARQHSGEVTSSYMMQGILSYLTSDCETTRYLLNNYIFKVIPMINVDGVVHGNTRSGLLGVDSNRKWRLPNEVYQPVVYQIKKIVEKDKGNVQMVLDLHSHSRKLGTFFYGNNTVKGNNIAKVFPMMVFKNDKRFDYKSNRFIGGSDETARKILYDILNIPLIYTVQSSFYGYQKDFSHVITPYQPIDYKQMGKSILETLSEYTFKKNSKVENLKLYLVDKESQLEEYGNLWDKMQENDDDNQSVGSDEDPTEGQFSKKERQIIIAKEVKKTKKKKKKVEKKPQKKEEKKQQIPVVQQPKKNDKQSHYKRFFSGRHSLSMRIPYERLIQSKYLPRRQKLNIAIQVNMIKDPERVLKASVNTLENEKKRLSFFKRDNVENKLCVLGQKVQDQLTIIGQNIGIQCQFDRQFLKKKAEIMKTFTVGNMFTKRVVKSNQKLFTKFVKNNENNFINKCDNLHSMGGRAYTKR